MVYTMKNNLVKGHGYSYQLNNKHDAIQLCNLLNKYENTVQLHENLERQFDQIQKQIVQIQMSVKILDSEISNLKAVIK